MTFKRAIYASTLAAGIGLAGLVGVGVGSASADPWGAPCNAPGASRCDDHHDNWNRDRGGPGAPVDWQHRGIDQGRGDHQPFNWNGQQVTPMPAGNGPGWGFWFGGNWIPL
ncbi:MAG: hypothetical protein QOJ24_1542 [Mycobacterium sp.]|nr:hypothetical protein [Mycobacterium sp.]